MENSQCVGCKSHFKEGEKLLLQNISIELKNYIFPIKEHKHKWNLLKTICSFLNSKGGTIFIGAEDKTGEVKGIMVQRKQLDDFRLFVQQLTEKIKPDVDLSDKEEVRDFLLFIDHGSICSHPQRRQVHFKIFDQDRSQARRSPPVILFHPTDPASANC